MSLFSYSVVIKGGNSFLSRVCPHLYRVLVIVVLFVRLEGLFASIDLGGVDVLIRVFRGSVALSEIRCHRDVVVLVLSLFG